MSIEENFYKAKALADAEKYRKACEEATAAGYVVADGHLSATGAVKNAPAAITPKEAKPIFSSKKKASE